MVSYPLFFVYLKDQDSERGALKDDPERVIDGRCPTPKGGLGHLKEIQQVVCDSLVQGGGADIVHLLGKLDRAKTTASGGRYKFVEAVKLDFDVCLDDAKDTLEFLEENDDDLLREYFKPLNLLQNDSPMGGMPSIFFFFQEIYGGAKTRIHLDENVGGGLEEVEISDVMDLRKTRNYLGILSAVAKKARNRTRHFRG